MNVQTCGLCGSRQIVQRPVFSRMLDLPGHSDCRVVECVRCGYRCLQPYLNDEQLARLYSEHYFTGETDTSTDGLAPGSASNYDTCIETRFSKFERSLELMLSVAPTARTILDIGAAAGDFLAIARRRGLRPSGIEYSAHAAKTAHDRHGLDVFVGRVEDFPKTERFDLIHLNHVFEHFTDPVQAAKNIGDLLAPGGVVYIEVPYQFNLIEVARYMLLDKAVPFSVNSLHHPVFFTPRTLTKLFRARGFRPLTLRVFARDRYPADSLVAWCKRAVWELASHVGQGTFIEAMFTVADEGSR